jgi:hypothetical protein
VCKYPGCPKKETLPAAGDKAGKASHWLIWTTEGIPQEAIQKQQLKE